MGTADYCALVALFLAAVIALSIRQEEQRSTDRRQRHEPPPGGIERRSRQSRRNRSFSAWVSWAAHSQWCKIRNLF